MVGRLPQKEVLDGLDRVEQILARTHVGKDESYKNKETLELLYVLSETKNLVREVERLQNKLRTKEMTIRVRDMQIDRQADLIKQFQEHFDRIEAEKKIGD